MREVKTIEHALFHCNYTRAVWLKPHFLLKSHSVPENGILEWWNEFVIPRSPFRFNNQSSESLILNLN